MTPHALLLLANLGRPRRPGGTTAAYAESVLSNPAVASVQLAEVVDRPVAAADLADLRRLQQAAVSAVEALVGDGTLDCREINDLAAQSVARVELVVADGVPQRRFVWTDASMAAALARRLIDELGELDQSRLRRCARAECDLIFYDTTRSRTRRWHAEDPCGWRERQRVHRGPRPPVDGGT